MLKFNAKTSYCFTIIFISVISILVTLRILRSRNSYHSRTTIKTTLDYYIKKLHDENKINKKSIEEILKERRLKPIEKFSIIDNLTMYAYPFGLELKEDNSISKFNMSYDLDNNKLTFTNLNLLSEEDYNETIYKKFLSKLILNINNTLETNETLDNIQKYFPSYRQINVNFWISNSNKKETYKEYSKYFKKFVSVIESFQLNLPINFKYIHYNSFTKLEESKNLYTSIKNLNNKRLFDELLDKDILNINLVKVNRQDDKANSYPIFNKDLNSYIFNLDFDQDINDKIFINLFYFLSSSNLIKPEDLTDYFLSGDNLITIFNIISSPKIRKHLMILCTLNNLDKISRIFPLYESILTINKVKPMVEEHMRKLREFLKTNFSSISMHDLAKLYVETEYLLDSNELVIFEHFFSDEFKIGQFLPIMVPILYAFIKSLKSVTV